MKAGTQWCKICGCNRRGSKRVEHRLLDNEPHETEQPQKTDLTSQLKEQEKEQYLLELINGFSKVSGYKNQCTETCCHLILTTN